MVTGSLAADSADEHADIDFLLIYPASRVWTSYAAARLLAKLPALGRLCPNYALPDDRLEIRPQNLFTAYEIAKAVPLFGYPLYERWIHANRWAARLLPNAFPGLAVSVVDDSPRPADGRILRTLTENRLYAGLERLEEQRKRARDQRDVGVDLSSRARAGSVDRHAPTRSFQALSELRYRLEMYGLDGHPLYAELSEWAAPLGKEMQRWGERPLPEQALA
jgi:hypothetical protein